MGRTLALNKTLAQSKDIFAAKKYKFILKDRDTFDKYLNSSTANTLFAPSFNQKGVISLD